MKAPHCIYSPKEPFLVWIILMAFSNSTKKFLQLSTNFENTSEMNSGNESLFYFILFHFLLLVAITRFHCSLKSITNGKLIFGTSCFEISPWKWYFVRTIKLLSQNSIAQGCHERFQGEYNEIHTGNALELYLQ